MNYDDLSKEALVEILKRRDAQAHYGLHWERNAIERDKALNRDFVGLELQSEGIALSELKGPQLQQYDRAKASARHLR